MTEQTTSTKGRVGNWWVLLILCSLHAGPEAAMAQSSSPTYLPAQVEAGKTVYATHCASCHGANLNDGPFAPPLTGDRFLERWGGKSVGDFFHRVSSTMPPATPNSLGADNYANLMAFLLRRNNVAPGTSALTADAAQLKDMLMPMPSHPFGQLSAGVVLPPPPDGVAPNPLDHIRPVTEELLRNPPDDAWLTWRRTVDASGFSPLKQINKDNVARLRLKWSWALANGPNESTPLVHDGVLFVYSYGDRVQALNAATGDLLWQYSRTLTEGAAPILPFKKAMALFGDRLYVSTLDTHMVALDVRNGNVIWDSPVEQAVMITGGPLVAKGKVIVGTTGPNAPAGGNFIVAFDAHTGKEAWRFRTIPLPGEPGGDTWNGLPIEKRSGASVWTPGSYDPDLNLVFFGPAPTYDTEPLRNRVEGKNNDALYTDTTVALDPDTGKLVWHYQHLANDQWDLDWAFERQIVSLPAKGGERKFVVTAGKPAIYDALDAASGKYAFSIDLALQNFITAIDPKTGKKTVDPSKVPGAEKDQFVCPHVEGGKNWIPASVNPKSKVVFVPLVESCMNMTRADERGLLTSHVRLTLAPRPDSDGRFGRLEAINLQTRKTVWTTRQRAALTMGTLATAGGLVFAGGMDRVFAAYDADNGEKLWSVRLNDVPNSNAISYAVDGKQYIAVISGNGGIHATLFGNFTPEIVNPSNRSSSVWVFEVPNE